MWPVSRTRASHLGFAIGPALEDNMERPRCTLGIFGLRPILGRVLQDVEKSVELVTGFAIEHQLTVGDDD